MKKRSDIGHLVRIENTDTGQREFIFLYILDDDPRDAYQTVIEGIRGLRLPDHLKKTAIIEATPITDFARIDRDFPETTGSGLCELPVVSFYRSKEGIFKERVFLNGVKNIIEKGGDFFPTNRLGAVATGSDFFARDDIMKKIRRQIGKGQNVIISGPRRYGKTSIMRRIKDEAKDTEHQAVMIDLESVFTPQELVAKIQVETEYPQWTETQKDNKISELTDDYLDRWADKGEEILARISKREQKVLFIFDEVPYMLDSFLGKEKPESEEIKSGDREEVNEFVAWFKRQRESFAGRLVFLLTGSIALKTYLKDNRIDKDSFSDCIETRLTFFDDETVRDYIESLLLGQEIILPDDIIDELVRINRPGIPYFIQIFMLYTAALYRKNPGFSVADLAMMYQEEIIQSDSRRFFDSFERHFKRYGKRMAGAKAILKDLSGSRDIGIGRTALVRTFNASSYPVRKLEFNILLEYLEHDFYIEKVKGTDRYRFASPILRDYWHKNQ